MTKPETDAMTPEERQNVERVALVGAILAERDRWREEAKLCREFIESIASGRLSPSMSDARYFLAGLDVAKAKGGTAR